MVTACAVRLTLFFSRFIIPLVIFVVCYWKIISSLRRRAKVAASQRHQPAANPSTSAAVSSRHSKAPSKTQNNVIITMIIIISCFIVSWLPFQFTIAAQFCGLSMSSPATFYYGFGILCMINFCAHPFIYATFMFQFLREKFVDGIRRLMRMSRRLPEVSATLEAGLSASPILPGRAPGQTRQDQTEL